MTTPTLTRYQHAVHIGLSDAALASPAWQEFRDHTDERIAVHVGPDDFEVWGEPGRGEAPHGGLLPTHVVFRVPAGTYPGELLDLLIWRLVLAENLGWFAFEKGTSDGYHADRPYRIVVTEDADWSQRSEVVR